MDPRATAGRSVHFTMDDGTPRAAIVNIDIEDPAGLAPELTVMFRDGPKVLTSVSYAETPIAGTWSWMDYQKAKAKTADGNISESAEPRPPTASEAGAKPAPQPPFSG